MKKKTMLYLVLCLAVIINLIVITNIYNDNSEKNETVNVNTIKKTEFLSDKNITQQKNEKSSGYLIKYYNGTLNVYDSDKNVIDSIAVDFDNMREYDKIQFEKGVMVNSIEDLKHIAEDFSE